MSTSAAPLPALAGPAPRPPGRPPRRPPRGRRSRCRDLDGRPVVDVVVPVYNEERDLEPNVRRLHAYLETSFPFPARITIADNASTDGTARHRPAPRAGAAARARRAARAEGPRPRLRAVWEASDAAVLAYMDVDLSTDLAGLLPLVAPLLSGHSDVAIGSRRAHGSRVVRGPRREVISRAYILLLRATLRTRFSDAQCGFKAIRADAARRVLPLMEDGAWFFDTEMLVIAERAGMRIHEVPVDWVDDPDSRVDIVRTALADLRGIARMRRGLSGGLGARIEALAGRAGRDRPGLGAQVLRFAAIGVASTIAYIALFLLLRGGLGRPGGERPRARPHRGREHRRQPATHLRRARPRPPGRSTRRRGSASSRWDSLLTSGSPRRAPRRHGDAAARRRGGRAGRRQRRGDPRALLSSCAAGCSARARAPRPDGGPR